MTAEAGWTGDIPLRRPRSRAVAWGDRRRGAGPTMSRRQTDLEPGVDPDAGETQPYRAPNGRPPTPPPSWRPDARRPGHPRRTRPRPSAARAPAHAPSGGGGVAVAALGALDRPRPDRGRVPRQQPRRQRLVEGRPHLLAVHDRGRQRQREEHRLQQVERLRSAASSDADRRQVGVLELGAEGQPARHDARADQEEGHRLQLRRRRQQHPRRHPALGPAARADHRFLRLDEPPRAGTDGRGDEHRQEPGQGLQHREAEDDVRRRRRLRPGEAGDHRGRRLPEEPGQVQGDRRAHPEGRAARRSARHRQDAHRPRRRR